MIGRSGRATTSLTQYGRGLGTADSHPPLYLIVCEWNTIGGVWV